MGIFGLGKKEYLVGKDILPKDITEFYYTDSASTNPPRFLRYQFRLVENQVVFHYEKREGDVWPLTEEHVSESKDCTLSEEQMEQFFELLAGGTVKKRVEDPSSGSGSIHTFLYWKKDHGKLQVFCFESYDKRLRFESFCEGL